ncbi:MAG: RidA family protein [Pirellulales bacterium]|nr:RidA family protein [Pirellulales bacterium]
MMRSFPMLAVLASALLALGDRPSNVRAAGAAESQRDASIEYVALDAPPGTSRAVIVDGSALAHTRQLLPLDREGRLVGVGSVEKQIAQVLDNLQAVLQQAGSDLDRLVRVNVYALSPATAELVREQLNKRLSESVRPALTSVLTPLPHREALVAIDAVATAPSKGEQVGLVRCEAVAGEAEAADVGMLPRGSAAYISGVPAEGGLTESAVDGSMAGLLKMLEDLKLSTDNVVHIKVFLRPASSADDVRQKLRAYFPDRPLPPVAFVEWLAPPPVEIELVAQLPESGEDAPRIEYFDPPEVLPMQIFCRATLVRAGRQIYVGGLFAREPGNGQAQALDVFDQLQSILDRTGSDLRHLAKGTYYVSDDDSARGMDRARLWLYDQDRPPAASKCMVHGVGQPDRTLTMDMIAIDAEQ